MALAPVAAGKAWPNVLAQAAQGAAPGERMIWTIVHADQESAAIKWGQNAQLSEFLHTGPLGSFRNTLPKGFPSPKILPDPPKPPPAKAKLGNYQRDGEDPQVIEDVTRARALIWLGPVAEHVPALRAIAKDRGATSRSCAGS